MKKQEIASILEQARINKVTPGAVVGWIDGSTIDSVASGRLTYEDNSPLVTDQTVYDVASITKSIPLSSLVHAALQEQKLSLETRAVEIMPELVGEYHDQITVRHLLTYTVIWDLPKGLSQYALEGADAVMEAITTLPLQAKPGEKYHYTNTPSIILGIMLERLYDKPLNVLAGEKLFVPLGMNTIAYDVSGMDDARVAPTEIDHRGEVRKVVHDETAYVLRQEKGIASGNAGIFSNVADLLTFCAMLMSNGASDNGAQIFSAQTLEAIQANQLETIGLSGGLGWELNQPHYMGAHSNDSMIGKTGFTGCVIMADIPERKAMVLLTNAQYPKRHASRDSINALRSSLADVVFGTISL